MPKIAYVVDFDGTITYTDISFKLVQRFNTDYYKSSLNRLNNCQLDVKTWLNRTIACFPPNLDLLLDFCEEYAGIREGFDYFLKESRKNNRPVVVASDGFGFYIKPILSDKGCLPYISSVYCNDLKIENDNVSIDFKYSDKSCNMCGNCKASHVIRLKQEGYHVVYVGDGINDRYGASWADTIFAKDLLESFALKNKYDFCPWTNFFDIVKPEYELHNNIPLCRPE